MHDTGRYDAAALVVCADFGSTFTKLAVIDLSRAVLVATAEHPTTSGSDVLDGFTTARAGVAAALPGADLSRVLACSSAGGGLRLGVVGYERAVTAEGGRRVGLSAGARVEHVAAGPLDDGAVDGLLAARPDVVLLVGGTDGGNAEVLLHNAARLAGAELSVPVVVAGNVEVRDEVCALLAAGGLTALPTANVLPRIGVLDAEPARATIRQVFIRHVIGGKGLSRSAEFAAVVRAATPDAVLSGVQVLADAFPGDGAAASGSGDVLVVDVGGATTDVYSVLRATCDEQAPQREVVEVLSHARTVEGDLGVRWGAPGVVAAAVEEGLLDAGAADELSGAAQLRAARPELLPSGAADAAVDLQLAGLAATVALRRHAGAGSERPLGGRRDLSGVALVVGSGGVFRHGRPADVAAALDAPLTDRAGGWLPPVRARRAVDARYVLAAAGLLAADHRDVAAKLLAQELVRPATGLASVR